MNNIIEYTKVLLKNTKRFGYIRTLQYFISQKILRINSNVPWPVHFTSIVSNPQNIKRHTPTANLGAMPGCYIQAINGIEIGKNTYVGPSVKIISANHNLYDFSIHDPEKPIIIGNNCWIGANAVILPGIKLADHTIVAAGAVVSKSYLEEDCIIGGVPAKILKKIGRYEEKDNICL